MNLHDYFRVLRRGWWAIIVITLLGAATAAGLAAVTPPTYRSSATLFVATVGDATPGDLQQGSSFLVQRVSTYADLADTAVVLDRAVTALDDGTDLQSLREAVTSSAREGTSLIDIAVEGDSAEQVAAQATAVADALSVEVSRLDAPVDGASPVSLTVVEPAEVPSAPIAPQARVNLVLGGVIGLVVGVAAVVIAQAFNTRIRVPGDLPRSGQVATVTGLPALPLRAFRGSRGEARLEAFRALRTNLQFGSRSGGTIAVVGVDSQGNARAVARRLGEAIGEVGARVVVVDLDLRPADGKRRGAPKRGPERYPLGVAEVLHGSAPIDEVVQYAGSDNVFTLSPGGVTPSTAQLVSTEAMRSMLVALNQRFDYVVLACPPLVERSEAAVMAALADRTLVVVESGATRANQFLFALELLAGVRVSSVSVAVDNVRDASGARMSSSLVPL